MLAVAGILGAACGGVDLPSGPDAPGSGPLPGELPPLRVQAISPSPGAGDVSVAAAVTVTFSRPVDRTTVNGQTFRVVRQAEAGDVPASGEIALSPEARIATFTPEGGFANNAVYTVTITSGVAAVGPSDAVFSGTASSFTTARAAIEITDRQGDAFGSPLSVGLVLPDLISVAVRQDPGGLAFALEFAESVDPRPTRRNAVGAFVDLDVDQDGATGSSGVVDFFRPPRPGDTGLGTEFVVNLRLDGTVVVNDAETEQEAGEIDAQFSGRVVTFTVPYALIGNDDGNVDLAAIVGTRFDATDITPDTGHVQLGRAPASGR